MKVAGVIAEFNPFHNGHAYMLSQTKERAGADYCIAVMSGDYVQRGMPALVDKYRRTQAALACGADLVLELPVYHATASAAQFAQGGVALLNQLGVVDTLAFGCETEDLTLSMQIADVLSNEPPAYRAALKAGLSNGLSYPAAGEAALCTLFPQQKNALQQLLRQPNSILAVSYLTALKKQKSRIHPLAIRRTDQGYHSDALTPPFAPAGALRSYLFTHTADAQISFLRQFMPAQALHAAGLDSSAFMPAQIQDFSLLLHHRLLTLAAEDSTLCAFCDVSDMLANRIRRFLPKYTQFSQFASLCKTKALTQTHVQRALLHILLDIRKTHLTLSHALCDAPYARVLGCRQEALPLLSAIKAHASIPLLTKPAQAKKRLSENALTLWNVDIHAAHTYQLCQTHRYGIPFQSEYTRQLCGLTDVKVKKEI